MFKEPEKFNITDIDEVDARRFTSHNNGVTIDKDAMLNFYKNEYCGMQNEWSLTGNRYTLFFREER